MPGGRAAGAIRKPACHLLRSSGCGVLCRSLDHIRSSGRRASRFPERFSFPRERYHVRKERVEVRLELRARVDQMMRCIFEMRLARQAAGEISERDVDAL